MKTVFGSMQETGDKVNSSLPDSILLWVGRIHRTMCERASQVTQDIPCIVWTGHLFRHKAKDNIAAHVVITPDIKLGEDIDTQLSDLICPFPSLDAVECCFYQARYLLQVGTRKTSQWSTEESLEDSAA